MSAEAVTMREVRHDDAASLQAMFRTNDVPEVTRHFHPFALDGPTARRVASYEGRDRYYVAEYDGAIVALSMLRGWDDGYAVPSLGIIVDRAWKGKGVGGRLTDFTIEEARRLGADRVRLSVYASNDVAYRLYRARKFIEESRTTVDTPFGEDVRIVMTRDLAP